MTGKTLEHTLHDYVKLVLDDYFQKLDGPPSQIYSMVISEVERALLQSILTYAHNNQSKTAQYLGLSRGTLRKKLKEYGLDDN